jgi:glycosyltransferase involved in cell wall biosynthesis
LYHTAPAVTVPLVTPARTLTIAHVDAEHGFSGGEVQVFLLIEGLARRGHANVLFCPPGSAAEARARERGIETRAVPMRNDADVRAVLALRRAFQRGGFDLVHLHTGRATWLGGLAARMARVPALTTRRMDRPVRRGWRTDWIYGSLVRSAVAISPAVAAELARGGVPPERTTTIASSVDPDALRPQATRAEMRRALGAGDGACVLLTLCSLVPRKGVDVLLEAFAGLPAQEPAPVLWVAGDGPEGAPLAARAAELGIAERVAFLGRRDDAPDLLEGCDVFVLPSRREGLGVAALEALAAGRPVVASRVGGLGQVVVDGESGLLVPPGDAEALRSALARVVASPELREALGRAGPLRVAQGYRADQMVAAYENLYHRILDEAAPGARQPSAHGRAGAR